MAPPWRSECGGEDAAVAAAESTMTALCANPLASVPLSDRSECRDFLGHCGTTIYGPRALESLCLYTALRKRGPIANE